MKLKVSLLVSLPVIGQLSFKVILRYVLRFPIEEFVCFFVAKYRLLPHFIFIVDQ
jgi:hypothetical protein